jgi:hypothetical protein
MLRDNPDCAVPGFRWHCLCTLWFVLSLAAAAASPRFVQQPPAGPTAEVPLVLIGGTVIDLTDWGHSARDLQNAVVIIREGKISEVGPASEIVVPKGARIIDCAGKFIIPGLVDGYAGMNSPGQARANLYMGVTTVVARSDFQHGAVDFAANPRPHIMPIDSAGTTDDWSLLAKQPAWMNKLREGPRRVELSPEDTGQQLNDTAKLGTRVILIDHNITAANTQLIITRAHQLGLVTYGEFVSTPYRVGVEAGVDALIHMDRYDLGLIPDELQQPLIDTPEGPAANTAYDYSQRIPPADRHVGAYAKFLASHHAALIPTLSKFYVNLPDHRNLWKEPAAAVLDPAHMFNPSNVQTGEMDYPLPQWTHRLPAVGQRWMEENQRKREAQDAMRMWNINETIFSAYPHYLAGSGAPVNGSMPGISLQTELELLVRLGLSSREAVAAATNNYSLQFGWNELGLIAPGRRADVLVIDGDPTVNVWNARRITTLIFDGNVIERESLLNMKR